MTKHNVRRFMGAGLIGLAGFALAACGGTPSESDLKDAFMENSESVTSAGIDEATYEEFVDCLVPKLTDGMSDDGLSAIVDADAPDASGNIEGVSDEDQKVLTDAATDCASVMVPEGASTSGS